MSVAARQAVEVAEAGKLVEVELSKGFAKVTLNNPKTLNCVNLQMVHELLAQLPVLNRTKAFWMEGAGDKAFCAGGDIKSLYLARQTNRKLLEQFFRDEFTLDYKLTKMNSLQISNWDGFVMGGGVGLSVFSPYRIATQNTNFAMLQSKIGFFTDVCGAYFLSRLRNNIGTYLGLTGMRLKGEEVYKAGIANFYIPRKDLKQAYKELKTELQHSQEPKETIDDVLGRYNQVPKHRVIEHEEDIRYIFNSKSFEEVTAKLNQNKNPFFTKVREAIEEQCPISAHVTFKNIQMSRTMTAKECFVNDFAVSQRFMQGHDFFEGVRCTLIDKNDKPKWSHKSIYDVSEKDVSKFFEPLPAHKELKL